MTLTSLLLLLSFGSVSANGTCANNKGTDSTFFLQSKCPPYYDNNCPSKVYDPDGVFEYRCAILPKPLQLIQDGKVAILNTSEIMTALKLKKENTSSWCMITMFYTQNCPFSAKLAEHFNKLPSIYKDRLFVAAIDAADFSTSRMDFRYGVSGTPTVLLWVSGVGVSRMNDEKMDLDALRRFIESYNDLSPVRYLDAIDNITDFEGVRINVTGKSYQSTLYKLLCAFVCYITLIYHLRAVLLQEEPIKGMIIDFLGIPMYEYILFLFYVPIPVEPEAERQAWRREGAGAAPQEAAPQAQEVPVNAQEDVGVIPGDPEAPEDLPEGHDDVQL